GVAERPFRCDVNGVRFHLLQTPFDVARCGQRQSDLGVTRQRQGPEFLRRQKFNARTEPGRFARHMPERAHDPVDLRMPGVGDDKYFHAACGCCTSAGSLPSRVHVMMLNCPSCVSATAVQLSTQSPQLMYRSPKSSWIAGVWMWPQITPSTL